MSDLVITSRPLVVEVLRAVEPYVVFKRQHVQVALRLLARFSHDRRPKTSSGGREKLTPFRP